jgi:transcription elongation GreA/GreB family factor
MSKAFTSEETEDEVPRGRIPPRAGELRPITRDGKAALVAELRAVQLELGAIKKAAGSGAITKSAAQEELARREDLLAATLATVVEKGPPSDLSRVSFGCCVEVENEQGARVTYQLVGPDETDARTQKISIGSPLGLALQGQAVDDEIEFERPRGSELLTIRAIRRR